MKVKLKHLGVLECAEFELGEFTIICGKNNTGKTYATYALFGFLHHSKDLLSNQIGKIIESDISDVWQRGESNFDIDIEKILAKVPQMLAEASKEYTTRLPTVFSSNESFFSKADFCFTLNDIDFQNKIREYEYEGQISNTNEDESVERIFLSKKNDSFTLNVSSNIRNHFLHLYLQNALFEILFQSVFPQTFIASAERTGAVIFSRELDFARNRLLKQISKDKEIDPLELLLRHSSDYPLPVETNVDFTRNLEKIVKKDSEIAKNHPEILESFASIIGGTYETKRGMGVLFKPKGKSLKLSIDESSSAVRSMLDVGFYLKHLAKPGDLLIIDEPELNLHPENQRLVARLLASLVNIGIKVFVTTHSDYFIKEINTLIMLNNENITHKKIMDSEGYLKESLLNSSQLKVYIAEKARIFVEEHTNKVKRQTLTSADINDEHGIEVASFDDTIKTMNRIQDKILWGDDE
jgi:ABC-type Mn2+/Zn2+ transport system ATPase subunit